MVDNAGHPFFKVNKDRTLAVLLVCITIAISLVGSTAFFLTAIYVSGFELIFIAAFLFINGNIVSYVFFKKNKLLFFLVFVWSIFVTVSLAQLFFQSVSLTHLVAAVFRYLFWVVHIVFAFCFVSYLSYSKYAKFLSVEVLPYIVVFIVGVYFFTLFYGPEIRNLNFIEAPPFAANIRHIGYICTVGAVISSFWVLTKSFDNRLMPLYAFVAIVNISFVFWLGGRGAIASVSISLMLCVAYLYKISELKLRKILFFLLLIVISIWCSYVASVFSWNGFSRVAQSLDGSLGLNSFSSGRLDLWRLSIDAALNSPWIGLGPEAFYFIPKDYSWAHPHNLLMQVFVEWGFIGGGLFLAFLLYSTVYGIKLVLDEKNAKKEICILSLLIVVSLTLHSLTAGTYYYAQPLYYLILAFSVFPAVHISNKHDRDIQ